MSFSPGEGRSRRPSAVASMKARVAPGANRSCSSAITTWQRAIQAGRSASSYRSAPSMSSFRSATSPIPWRAISVSIETTSTVSPAPPPASRARL